MKVSTKTTIADHITDEGHGTSNTEAFTGKERCPICRLCTEQDVTIPEPGTLSKEHHSPCAAHVALLSWVERSLEEEIDHFYSQSTYHQICWRPYSLTFWRTPEYLPRIELWDNYSPTQFSRELLVRRPQDENRPGLHNHNLDPKWIDLQIARQWMNICNTKHGSRCTNPFKSPPCYPAYLIDTELNSLIRPGNKKHEYVALSYRWGDREGFRTDRTSVQRMADRDGISLYDENIPLIGYYPPCYACSSINWRALPLG